MLTTRNLRREMTALTNEQTERYAGLMVSANIDCGKTLPGYRLSLVPIIHGHWCYEERLLIQNPNGDPRVVASTRTAMNFAARYGFEPQHVQFREVRAEQSKERGVWVTQAHMRLTGSPDCALFLAQCVYWSKCDTVEKRSGWFYKTRDEWKAETCLSRYKQEKARQRLKELGVLQERHERRNDGIRLWYRINLGLLNRQLNQLAIENDMNVRSEKTTINELIDRTSENVCTPTDTKSVDDSESAEKYYALMPEISTNVQTETEQHYSLNPEDYVFCHVFIYQFVRAHLPHYKASWQQAWQAHGLDDHDLFDLFCRFVERYGQDMVDWYKQTAAIDVPTLTADDIVFAQISGRFYAAA